MTERREPEHSRARAGRRQSGPEQGTDPRFLGLQQQAGNKAVADLLGSQAEQPGPASPALRLRDTMRADRPPMQREFGLNVQRIGKGEAKMGRTLTRGSRGGDVATLQQLLGISADGIFGGQTRAQVIEFQRANGLTPDGVVGPMTWAALTSAKGATAKMGGESTAKMGGESTAKMGGESTAKMGGESTEKMGGESTDKMSESTDKFESTEKLG